MLDRFLSHVPGTRAHARHGAIANRIVALGRALREPRTADATMDLAIAIITSETRPPAPHLADHPVPVSLADLASDWADVLAAGSYLPLRREQVRDVLLGMAQQLLDCADAEAPQVASRVGRELGQCLRVTPLAFEDLFELLIPWIEHHRPGDDQCGFPIRTETLAALAGGFAAGVRDRIFDEQSALNETTRTTGQTARLHLLTSPLVFQTNLVTTDQPMAVLDRRGKVLVINDAGRDLLALNPDNQEVLLEDCAYGEADSITIRTLLDDILHAGTVHPEFAVAWPEGTFKAWVSATMRWHQGTEHGPGRICAVLADATRHHAWRRHLDHLAKRDDATGLPSRRSFLARTQSTLDELSGHDEIRIGICLIRLGGLTRITRELGPRHGHVMITTLADRFTGAVSGSPATAIARLERDTFAVLLADTADWVSIGDMIRRVSDWLSEPVRVGHHILTVIPRVAIAETRPGTISVDDLLRRAETTLSTEATATRRPWIVTEETVASQQHQRARLIAALPDAVAGNALALAYSPITGVQSGVIVGLQVHTYWHHPHHGALLVDDLAGPADDLGVTLPTSRWAIQQAAGHAAMWRKMFRTSAPFVLLSIPRRLAGDEALVAHVRDTLASSGLPPQLLSLAVPGDAVLDDRGDVHPHLAALDGMGVPLLLDGLGTNFSQYHRLPDVPVHGVVLSTELTANLRDASSHRKTRALTHSLISLAADLGLTTLLRDITTPDQLHDARLTTADLAQGDLIGRPLPACDIDALLYDRPLDLPHNWAHHPPWRT